MHGRYVLPDWNSLAACGDDELPLLDTALLIARDEYPQLDAGAYTSTIQGYADALKPRLDGDVDLPAADDERPGLARPFCAEPSARSARSIHIFRQW